MVSVIIPSYKDPILHKTIDSIIDNFKGEFEIVVVLDGYWPTQPIKEDERIRVVHIGKNGGMRRSINAGVRVARGEFIMRTDEHCMYAPGFDLAMTERFDDDCIMVARRHYLDPVQWKVMDDPYIDYEKLVISGGKKFTGKRWTSRDIERKDILLDETMAMQGSMWMMKKAWWEKVIGELQTEGYGPLIQDSHEMIFKTWKAGGKMMLNKNTWYAHKHRSFSRTHNNGTAENPSNDEAGYAYALSVWRDYYEKEIQPRWKI